jgi:hypothetical protein
MLVLQTLKLARDVEGFCWVRIAAPETLLVGNQTDISITLSAKSNYGFYRFLIQLLLPHNTPNFVLRYVIFLS